MGTPLHVFSGIVLYILWNTVLNGWNSRTNNLLQIKKALSAKKLNNLIKFLTAFTFERKEIYKRMS